MSNCIFDEACRQRRRRAPVHGYWIFDQTFAIIDEGRFLLFSPPERMNNPTQALRRLLRDLVAAGDDYKKMRDGRLG